MGAPGMTTGLSRETFENLQLNAGIFIKNFDYSDVSDASELATAIATAKAAGNHLGATRGGGSFNITREIRSPEVDGRRYPFVGDKFVDSVDAYLSTTLLEETVQNILALLGSATATQSGKKTVIKMGTVIGPDAYITSLSWIGNISDGRFVIITLRNALNTADFTLTFADKNEGTRNAEFHAHQDYVDDYDEAPFEIVYFDPDDEADLDEIGVASAAGSAVGGTAITISEYTLPANAHYVYKVGTSGAAPTIGYLDTPDYTWTEWDGTSDIAVGAGANGKKATIAAVNASGKAIAAGSATLAVKMA